MAITDRYSITEGIVFASQIGDGFTIEDFAQIIRPPAWHADAACREHPEIEWFPSRGESLDAARAVCATCIVRDECRADSIDENYGVWAGLSERERQRDRAGLVAARKAERAAARAAEREARAARREAAAMAEASSDKTPLPGVEHGLSGRRKGCPCDTCTDAHRQYQREWARAHRRAA